MPKSKIVDSGMKESVRVLNECIDVQLRKSADYQNPDSKVFYVGGNAYLKKIDQNLTKTSMFLTVFMDRIYGLIALILITGIISISRFSL